MLNSQKLVHVQIKIILLHLQKMNFFSVLGLEDIELLNEYMLVMKPFAGVLDIFRAKRGVSYDWE
jgi:hypothetical protein